MNAISGWEFQHQAGHSEPLVLALTGPTGVGKSETAYRIAEGALAKQRRIGQSAKYLPSGLLMLRGEDYSGGDLEQVTAPSLAAFLSGFRRIMNHHLPSSVSMLLGLDP